jgi:hypothetical protein
MPCAIKPNMMPPKTSPDPAVAKLAGALVFTTARPSGAAITVSVPFNTIIAPLACAAARARRNLSPAASNSLANSPSCGVRMHGPLIASDNAAGRSAKTLIASASSSTARRVASMASARARVVSLTPAPGPISSAV